MSLSSTIAHSNQFYINIKDKPEWVTGKSFEEQSRTVQQFYISEGQKIINGVTIGGVKIHPWLYWHINFWHMLIDVPVEGGHPVSVHSLSNLRDNEWLFQDALNRATEENKGIIGIGTRRQGKSAFISSYLAHSASTKFGGELRVNSVIGGTQKDLDNIADYTSYGLKSLHPFFTMDMVGKDWTKGVTLGTRNLDNSTDIFSKMTITNVVSGSVTAAQKAAGATPNCIVFDEIGKYDFMSAFNAAKYSLATGYGWRTIPILLGTSGDMTQVQAAQKMASNPEAYNMIAMDWEWLERRCKFPTWAKKNWGVFFPGQMSLDAGAPKVRVKLSDFLGIPNSSFSELYINETNWGESKKALEKKRKSFIDSGDKAGLNSEMMFIPMDTDDCFLSSGNNPFPTVDAQKHRNDLQISGDVGKVVDFIKENGENNGKVSLIFSKKPIAKFPFEGGILDCGIKVFEDPPSDNSFDYTYVAGLDHYKHTESTGDSIGSLYVFKRMTNLNDPFNNTIVCSYTSRPASMNIFNRTCEMILDAYGAECLQENADLSFQQYLEGKGKDIKLLANGEDIVKRLINGNSRQLNKFGMSPTAKNKEYLLNLVISYTWEVIGLDLDDNGFEKQKLGVYRIKDIELLDEIISYKPGKNVDRIISFGHALVWARYLDDIRVVPRTKGEKDTSQKRHSLQEKSLDRRSRVRNPYGTKRTRGNNNY